MTSNKALSDSRMRQAAITLGRILTRVAWICGVLTALSISFGQAIAQGRPAPNDPIVLLLKGNWVPVVSAPSLGLPGVNLNDGTWIVNDIHSVSTIPGSSNQNTVIGKVYAQVTSALIAYDLPGGVMLMEFTAGAWDMNPIPDGHGGLFYQETWDLTILVANGIYSQYQGGHNHMVDRYDSLSGGTPGNPANGPAYESCFCILSIGGGLPLWWTSI